MENHLSSNTWSNPKKIAFRYVFIFFALFLLIYNNGIIPYSYIVLRYPSQLLEIIIPWIGKHILHLSQEITDFTNGSGDTTYDYVVIFTLATTALLGTIIWSVLDRKKNNYVKLYYWLTVAVRFYIGLLLIQYGLLKIIKLQFPSPNFVRLSQNYGDSSPMGLAWTFLGFSKGYNLFMGIIEVSSILLLFRRTMTFGAIITLTSTINIMAVNYFFDVPVKILSTALVIMTIFLLLNNIKQLLLFFFTGESVSLSVIKAPELNKKWLRIAKLSFKLLLISFSIIYTFNILFNRGKERGDFAPKPKLYGLYNVYLYKHNNDTIPPLITDSVRWSQFIIDREGYATVRSMTSKQTRFTTIIDTVSRKIQLTSRDSTINYLFAYEYLKPDKLILKGSIKNDSLSLVMTRKKIEDYLLMNRGFHWINETPFNK
jgi:hypothetical protein